MEITPTDEMARQVVLGVLYLEDVSIPDADELTDREMSHAEALIRERFTGKTPSEIPELAPARSLYKAAGIDPTRHRPSNEALIRRVLRGGTLPRINPAVDLGNLAAVVCYLSLGLYDAGKLRGPVRMRLGRTGESYPGIRKDEVRLGGRLVLEDDLGPFGNPTSDSARTRVTGGTTRLLWVFFAPPGYERQAMASHLEWARARVTARLGATAQLHIVGGA